MLKKLICLLLGHEPRGPISEDPPYLYSCDRCQRLIKFDRDLGWYIYHE